VTPICVLRKTKKDVGRSSEQDITAMSLVLKQRHDIGRVRRGDEKQMDLDWVGNSNIYCCYILRSK